MRAEHLAIGSELLGGSRPETLSDWLAPRLDTLGLDLARKTVVPDSLPEIGEALAGARARGGVLVVTGGLGPTDDDLTREALARHLGRALVADVASGRRIRARLRKRGLPITDKLLRQALVPRGATALVNRAGTAAGVWVRSASGAIAALPGVPAEMFAMFEREVVPRLKRLVPPGHVVRRRTLRVAGLSESEVDRRIGALAPPDGNPSIGVTCEPGEVAVHLRAHGMRERATRAIATLERAARAALGDRVFGSGADSLEAAVGAALARRGLRLATAESCTGGLLASRVTDVPGSSAWYRGGFVVYEDAAKVRDLGVTRRLLAAHGAVSAEVARAMARGARRRSRADVSVALTGIAGPGGGSRAKPVGLVFLALDDAGGTVVERHAFAGERARVKRLATQAALLLLRDRVAGTARER